MGDMGQISLTRPPCRPQSIEDMTVIGILAGSRLQQYVFGGCLPRGAPGRIERQESGSGWT